MSEKVHIQQNKVENPRCQEANQLTIYNEAKEVNSQDYLLELQLADSNCIASSVIIMFRQLDNDILSIFYILSGCFRFPNH